MTVSGLSEGRSVVSVAEGGVEGGPKWPVAATAATARQPRLSLCDGSCTSAIYSILSHHLFSFVVIIIAARSAKDLSLKPPQIVSQYSIFPGKYLPIFCDKN